MHILLIHQAFASITEPGGTRHHEIAQNMAEKGHHVTVIASSVSYLTGNADVSQDVRLETDAGGQVNILRAYTYAAWHRSFVHRVFSFLSFMVSSFFIGLRVQGVDLVWGTSPPIFQGVTAWLLARLKRSKFLFEVRDLWPAFAIAVGVLTNRPLILASQWLERFLYRRADRMLVNSPGFIEHIQNRGGRDIALVPNGADPSMFDPVSEGTDFRRQHGLSRKFVALYAGAHGMSNDLDILLDAADQLRERADIRIAFLGSGKEKPALMERAERMGLRNVIFIPPVPKTEMGQALAASNACIAILKPIEMYKTVYPNKVFDYMAAGRAVILAIDGVIRQVVEKALAGICVPPGDAKRMAAAIRLLADDSHAAKQMGIHGRKYIEAHFDRRKLSAEMERIFKQLILE